MEVEGGVTGTPRGGVEGGAKPCEDDDNICSKSRTRFSKECNSSSGTSSIYDVYFER